MQNFDEKLTSLPGWKIVEGRLTKIFKFTSFPTAVLFVNRLVDPAEELLHYPEVTLLFNQVRISLIDLHSKNYTAIDADTQTIIRAESKNAEDSKIIFQRADVLRLPFNKSSFDVVIMLDTLHHVDDWRRAIREIKRVLKPKGKFLFRDYSMDTYSMPLLGIITRQIVDRPFDHMFDQVEFSTYRSESGFHIT